MKGKNWIITMLVVMMVLAFVIASQAKLRQTAAYPGEALAAQNSATTPLQFFGLFYCIASSTGVGNIYIQRSEDATNWALVKIINKPDTKPVCKPIYEQFGDENIGKAYYRAILLDNPGLASGSLRVRFSHWDTP